jgi:hypothetical protein
MCHTNRYLGIGILNYDGPHSYAEGVQVIKLLRNFIERGLSASGRLRRSEKGKFLYNQVEFHEMILERF